MAAKPSPSKIDAIATSVKKESTDRLVTEPSNYKPVDYPLERLDPYLENNWLQ